MLYIWGIFPEWIAGINVYGDIITLQLPAAGDFNIGPAFYIEIRFIKIKGSVIRFADPVKFPFAVKRLMINRSFSCSFESGLVIRIRKQGAMWRLFVNRIEIWILPVVGQTSLC